MKRALWLTLSSTIAFSHVAYGQGLVPPTATAAEKANPMEVAIKVGDRSLTATLVDNETARDFASLLPLTLTMHDLFGREKAAALPRPLAEGRQRMRTFEVGELVYWSPNSDLAIYYHHDGASIPSPGIVPIGKIRAGVEAFNVRGTVAVRIAPIGR